MLHELGTERCWVAVISAGRPQNVERMHCHLDGRATWIVPEEQIDDYREAGAASLVPGTLGKVARSRNLALDAAWEASSTCVQLDDDLKRVRRAVDGKGVDITLPEALSEIVERLHMSDFYYAGGAPTDNPYFSRRRTSTNLFIKSGCTVVRRSELRYEESLQLKEDYDFTAQHITTFGGALRCDDILFSWEQYTNAGGCSDFRSAEAEEESIRWLLGRWPGMIKRHPRREHEVLLKAPARRREAL